MTTLTYWMTFAIVVVYLAIIVRAWKITRSDTYQESLAVRIAPYRGGWIARTQADALDLGVPDAIVNGYQDLRRLSPPETQELITSLERAHLLSESLLALHERVHPFDVDEPDNVVQLHQHSVKVS